MNKILKHDWLYSINKSKEYGFELRIYKNTVLVHKQGGYGTENTAYASARDYVLLDEFNIGG